MSQYDLTINKGETFIRRVIWKDATGVPINLTMYTARMQVRKSINDATALIDINTENGGIVLIPGDGAIDLRIEASVTSLLTATRAVYDLELISGDGTVTRLLEGGIEFTREVTR